jgi:hypothetical protein
MASNINATNIDGTYPVAGQDNDSQGFRTNFTNIKNNVSIAKTEIEDLQSKVIVKAALTGTTVNNDMAGTVFHSAEIKDIRETRVDFGTTSGTLDLDHSAAHNYTVTTSGSVTLSFSNIPAAGKVGRIRLEISVTNTAHTMTLPSAVSKGTDGIAGLTGQVVTFNETGDYHFEFWTDDSGTSLHIEDKTRNKTYFNSTEIQLQTRTPANIGAAGDVAGMVALDASYMYICTAAYDGATVIWKRAGFSVY